jgi:hypothetical protein
MKKALLSFLFLALSGLFTATCHAGGALNDLNNAARDGEAATREPSSEGKKEGAGQGFDTSSSSTVDLTGKKGVVDPADLKKYDPKTK